MRAALTDHMATSSGDAHWYLDRRHFKPGYDHHKLLTSHHGRLWNAGLGVYPALPGHPAVPWLVDASVLLGPTHSHRRRRLYPVLVSINSVLTTISPRSSWGDRLVHLFATHPNVPLDAVGMPTDWWQDPFWQAAQA